MLDAVSVSIKSSEANVDSNAKPDLPTFAATVLADFKYSLIQHKKLQSQIVTALTPASTSGSTDTRTAALANLSSAFTTVLKGYATDVVTALKDTSTAVSKLLKPNTVDPSLIPDPTTYASVVFAPSALAFTDTDTSTAIGGRLVISLPTSPAGITSYHVYFGGETASTRKIASIGTVLSTASPLQLVLAARTTVPTGATRFWVYPVVADQELDVPASLAMVNVIGAGSTVSAPPTPLSLTTSPGASRTVSTWAGGGGSTAGYLLVRSASGTPTWQPTSGQSYSIGTLDTNTTAVYVGAALTMTGPATG